MLSAAQTPRRRLFIVAAALHLVLAIALLAIAVSGASILLPVGLALRTDSPGQFAVVDLAAAAAVVVLVSVLCRASAASTTADSRRSAWWYLEASQASGITMFLIAQLNGITETGTLVLCYAVAAGSVALLWVQSRRPTESRADPWPFSVAAAIAIVPWGVVALYQVTGLVVSSPPSPIVRVVTVVVLALFCALWWSEKRSQLGLDSAERLDVVRTALMLALGLVLLVLVAGLSRPSALV